MYLTENITNGTGSEGLMENKDIVVSARQVVINKQILGLSVSHVYDGCFQLAVKPVFTPRIPQRAARCGRAV